MNGMWRIEIIVLLIDMSRIYIHQDNFLQWATVKNIGTSYIPSACQPSSEIVHYRGVDWIQLHVHGLKERRF